MGGQTTAKGSIVHRIYAARERAKCSGLRRYPKFLYLGHAEFKEFYTYLWFMGTLNAEATAPLSGETTFEGMIVLEVATPSHIGFGEF